ncbi:intercellular adhesion molecule 5 [Bombina bombina]|uniref:intercellular adhesion molecule 5 n=1 Tax=Bombina bombina TaxID=8345 RepID=UPI00235A5E8C|nr:intercellular adhesion molecule 5 [Bombina bombina]
MMFRLLILAVTVFNSIQQNALLVPTLTVDDSIEENEETTLTCSFPKKENVDVNLTIIHKDRGPMKDCQKSTVPSHEITCKATFCRNSHDTEVICEAYISIASQPKRIYVQSDPEFTVCPENVTWLEGEKSMFHCKAEGYPKPNVTCKGNTSYEDGKEFIAFRNMSGTYICKALTSGDMVTKTVLVNVEVRPRILNAEVCPGLIVDKGANVTLNCEAEGIPLVTYSWNTPTTEIELSADNRTITIQGMDQIHAGDYICKAQNKHGVDTKVQTLSVKDKPKILKFEALSSIPSKKGDDLTLVCEAKGIPSPTFSWKTPTSEFKLSADHRSIKVKNIGQKHIGSYICEAQNQYGVDTKMLNITIADKPKILKIKVQAELPLKKGAAVSLTCEADGFPPPTISWETPKSKVQNSQNIVIQSVDKTHMGNYTCKAHNEYGVDTRIQNITIQGLNKGEMIKTYSSTLNHSNDMDSALNKNSLAQEELILLNWHP